MRWTRSGSSSMMARRSRSALNIFLAAIAVCACAGAPHRAAPSAAKLARHPLENPPRSQDLVARLAFRDARAGDTLAELGVGYTELVAANPGVDPWLPKAGTRLVVPNARLLPSNPREGIVVNLGDL